MSRGRFTTALHWEVEGEEISADVRVIYSFCPGYPPTMEEPGSEGEAEIISIMPTKDQVRVPDSFFTDESLLNECVSDWLDEQEAAAEWRAQCRRDDALMERFK